MSETSQGSGQPIASESRFPTPPGPVPVPYPATPVGPGANRGPLGNRENIPLQVLLSIVTLGLYGWYWAYKSHEEIKQHTGGGVGGLVGVLVYIFVPIVTLFLLPLEIKRMYEREGLESPVGAATAFWILLFLIPWYVKCQAALNRYWEMKGVPA